MRSIRHFPLWLVGAIVVLASGCQTQAAHPHSPERQATAAPVIAHRRWVHHFTTLQELVKTADAVVVGTITTEGRGPLTGPTGEQVQDRLLHLTVEERLAGSLRGTTLPLAEQGWLLLPEGERPILVQGTLRLSPGDRGLFAVAKNRTGPYYHLINDQGGFLLTGGIVANSNRSDHLVRLIEQLPEARLKRLIRDA